MGFKLEQKEKLKRNNMDYIYAPIPEPNKCRCGNSKHKDGLCDGSHLQESQETKDESTK